METKNLLYKLKKDYKYEIGYGVIKAGSINTLDFWLDTFNFSAYLQEPEFSEMFEELTIEEYKKLDKKDIESLGFQFAWQNENKDVNHYIGKELYIIHFIKSNNVIIKNRYCIPHEKIFFEGIVNNKSELKKVLQPIINQINKNENNKQMLRVQAL